MYKNNNEVEFLTAREVSSVFFQGKLPYSGVLKMTRNGELPAMKRGKSYIYMVSALKEWAQKNLSKPSWANKQKNL
ncbi:helix-turn-helix domain-containing protein [Anaerosinus gibii]|uniref:Helix-turn-helix domain-containing protein n=1 Tax=Selenobaculum gibii TaxID=3054208 RepID=A0A9Y2AHJ4_9FIRM|nr:helix-turn-helix domain-containing protein [Selenobaculum gbiensis]WIW69891.1 helix-turn-helix domain-containing protein [Selenobaculum gbiensis]